MQVAYSDVYLDCSILDSVMGEQLNSNVAFDFLSKENSTHMIRILAQVILLFYWVFKPFILLIIVSPSRIFQI